MSDELPSKPRHTEPAILRRLPLWFALVNVVISLPWAIIEIVGTMKGWRMGDSIDGPCVLLLIIDFPVSAVAAGPLADYCMGGYEQASNFKYWVVTLSSLLITGAAWYYLIGLGLRWLIRAARKNS